MCKHDDLDTEQILRINNSRVFVPIPFPERIDEASPKQKTTLKGFSSAAKATSAKEIPECNYHFLFLPGRAHKHASRAGRIEIETGSLRERAAQSAAPAALVAVVAAARQRGQFQARRESATGRQQHQKKIGRRAEEESQSYNEMWDAPSKNLLILICFRLRLFSGSKETDELKFNSSLLEATQLKTENRQLQLENSALRNSILALNSEVCGAKLAAKYLDKELAGRIQQLQLLGDK